MSIGGNILRWWCIYFRHTRKNSKLAYYLRGRLMLLTPRWLCRLRKQRLFRQFQRMSDNEKHLITERVNYYCNPVIPASIPADAPRIGEMTLRHRVKFNGGKMNSVYFFDSYEYSRCFPKDKQWLFFGGDCNYNFPQPVITKARLIAPNGDTNNNVLLNMNKVRHFTWIYDPFKWEEKNGMVLFRGDATGKPARQRFMQMWQEHPLCDIESTGKMALYDHLKYRYIMALEGNDVASNLKWVMSSNSVAVMPKPTCETWFMEGKLIPDYHYIEIAPDFHDLIEKIEYYESHPDEAKAIVRHAHEWVRQFQDKEREDIISLMVLDKYFQLTGQYTKCLDVK